MKKLFKIFIIIYLIMPIYGYAYSDYIIASGDTIGIELKMNSALVVGSYKIDGYDPLKESALILGDKIIKVNGIDITGVESLQSTLNKLDSNMVTVTYIRDNLEYNTDINVFKDGNNYKTGLYVRDSIRGIGTLTYIDPGEDNNPSFGSLGHEIVEKNTKSLFDMDYGKIFTSIVTGITRSSTGNPGEKNAKSNSSDVVGSVKENTKSGVFGEYTGNIDNSKLYKVVDYNEIELGSAKIRTVIKDNKIEEFDINIIKINNNSNTKNILFEVVDERLLSITGGIVQGMSGSPIIQGDNIIGAVNYVLVDSPTKGYGIFITNMLSEAEN